jgi:prevent-host-death family protein
MHSVNVAKLKNSLSKYLRYAKNGEEVVIRERNLPIAKLVPFTPGDATEEELKLVAAGKMRLPKVKLDPDELDRMPMPRVSGRKATEALLADREESL